MYGLMINDTFKAFHKNKDVINIYAERYKISNPKDNLKIAKLKKSAKNKLNYADFYLEEYYGQYIQSKYIDAYIYICSEELSLNESIMNIEKFIVSNDISKKDKKVLIEGLDILKSRLNKMNNYVPSINSLECAYWTIQEYKNKI